MAASTAGCSPSSRAGSGPDCRLWAVGCGLWAQESQPLRNKAFTGLLVASGEREEAGNPPSAVPWWDSKRWRKSLMVLLRSKSGQAGRPGMAAPLCTPARPLHLPSALLGSWPLRSQKETRLKVGWITVGGGGGGHWEFGGLGSAKAVCSSSRDGCPCQGSLPF